MFINKLDLNLIHDRTIDHERRYLGMKGGWKIITSLFRKARNYSLLNTLEMEGRRLEI